MAGEMVTMPALVTLPGVDIVAAGTWSLSTGEATFTTEDLSAAVEASQCPSVGSPIIKIGHTDARFAGDGEPALGRVTSMALATEGNKIIGDLAGMPGWLGAVASSAYPQRSIEGYWDFVCQQGHSHPFVITAVALLGVAAPGVGVLGGLEDVAAPYGVAVAAGHARGPWQTTAGGAMPQGSGAQAAAVTVEDIRRAYYASGVPMSYWITEMQLAPPQLIVADEATDKVYRVPVKIKGDAITFGDSVEVEVEYKDVAATRASGMAVVFATAEESRSVVAKWDGAMQVSNMGDSPTSAALKKMFALPADTKTASKLPHHDCASGGSVGGPDLEGCQAAIGVINGARGGLKGVSAADLKKAYNHLAKHVTDLGGEPAGYSGPSASAAGGDPEDEPLQIDAAGKHGAFKGTHSHPHAAMGAQGGDKMHDHPHTHAGDGVHNHSHASGAGPTRKGVPDVDFTDEQMAALRTRLGLAEDAELTAEQIMAALAAPPASGEPEPVPAAAGAPAQLPPNVLAVDKAAWDEMGKRAQAGEQALARMRRNERDQVIGDAVRAGKFAAAQVEAYQKLWDSAPEHTRAVIAGMAKNVVPVGDVGLPGMPDEDLDAEYVALFGRDGGQAGA
jgi:hypothetical protein